MSSIAHSMPCFRSLFEAIFDSDDDVTALLSQPASKSWFAKWEIVARDWFMDLSTRAGNPVPAVSVDELWELYAFSRVNQTLMLAFQPTSPDHFDWAPKLSLDEYRAFMFRFDLDIVTANGFSPFFHEIVTVEQSPDDDMLPTIRHVLWPAVMLGGLLISRAGVVVAAGKNHLVKNIAETATLYFEYRRRHRSDVDLSDGWGSNSQWRTCFRRDYLFDGYYHFNVDGTAVTSKRHPTDVAHSGENRSAQDLVRIGSRARIELLIHRSFVVTKNFGEQWPFDDTYRTPVAKGLIVTRDNGRQVRTESVNCRAVEDVTSVEIAARIAASRRSTDAT